MKAMCWFWNSTSTSPSSAMTTSTTGDRKSTRLNSSHSQISYAVFCLKKKNKNNYPGCGTDANPAAPNTAGNEKNNWEFSSLRPYHLRSSGESTAGDNYV